MQALKIKMPAINIPPIVRESLQPPLLLRGLGGALLLYILIFSLTALTGNKTRQKQEARLASETVLIERASISASAPVSVSEHLPGMAQETATHPAPVIVPPKGQGLPPAPIKGLYEKTDHGFLPKMSEAGGTPFESYKRPFAPTTRPLITITVSDYGLSEKNAALALELLPPEVSLILSPYAVHPDQMQKKARAFGHELWLGLPVNNHDDPNYDSGPQAISNAGGLKYNRAQLYWAMSRTTGYAGITAFLNAHFDQSGTVSKKLFGEIFARGLGYFEMNPAAENTIETMALGKKAPYVRNARFLEEESLKALEAVAREKGYVVGVVYPHPNNINALKTWLETLQSKGFALAPLSAIAEHHK